MRQTTRTRKSPGEKIAKDIKRATRKQYSSEEKIRIVLDGLRGEDSIAELCRREGISQGVYYKWSKDFMEAGKRRLAGDTARAANTDEVKDLRREARDLKEVVAEQNTQMTALSPEQTCSEFQSCGRSKLIALAVPSDMLPMQPRKRPLVVAAARFGAPMTELRDKPDPRRERSNV